MRRVPNLTPIQANFEDPDYWLNKAEEARVMAERMELTEARLSMLGIARAYAHIAERIKARRDWR